MKEVAASNTIDMRKITYLIPKRIIDVIFSLIGCIFLIPIATVIKISYVLSGDKYSIFFKQQRTGKNGKNFELIKFRSMVIDNDVRDNSKEDKFTKVGKIIRKLSIDELPQMINVFCY